MIVPDVLGGVARALVEDGGEVAAQDLDVARERMAVGLHGEAGPGRPVLVDELQTDLVGDFGPDALFEAHARYHGARRPADVYPLAGGAEGGRSLDDGGADRGAVEPVG